MRDDLINRRATMQALAAEYNRRFMAGDRGGLKMAWIEKAVDDVPSAQPEQDFAHDRYEDLCEYFQNDARSIETILNNRKEFKDWLERMHWHVMECDKLARELEKYQSGRRGDNEGDD